MQTGITGTDTTVQVMQKSGAKMEKLDQGRNGHLARSLIIPRCIAVYVGKQVIISKMYHFGNFSYLLHYLGTNW